METHIYVDNHHHIDIALKAQVGHFDFPGK